MLLYLLSLVVQTLFFPNKEKNGHNEFYAASIGAWSLKIKLLLWFHCK